MMEWSRLLASIRSGESKPLSGHRSFFEQDFDRVIFSQPFRKLQDKTQVFPLPEDDFVHTRLTHSLEVSSVGRSLGKMVGGELLSRHKDLTDLNFSSTDIGAIVGAAALAHDVGNPPFGHTGEEALSDYFKNGNGKHYAGLVSDEEWNDLVNFEGNAQGYRILTNRSVRLSNPVLGAFIKYPRSSSLKNPDSRRRSQRKYGYFQSEKDHIENLVESLGLKTIESQAWCRHPLAFLVEAADDICYHIIDMEDGCTIGLIEEQELVDLTRPILGDSFNFKKYRSIATRRERIGTLRAMAINELITEAAGVFSQNEEHILSGEFDAALMEHTSSKPHLDEIIRISIERLYHSRIVTEIEVAGFEVLGGLLDMFSSAMVCHFTARGSSTYDKTVLRLIPEDHLIVPSKNSTYIILRNCVDFISGMTDSYAISTYKKLKGISLFRR